MLLGDVGLETKSGNNRPWLSRCNPRSCHARNLLRHSLADWAELPDLTLTDHRWELARTPYCRRCLPPSDEDPANLNACRIPSRAQ